jgi:DHA2 family multidrug resistance protein-like MFS transporter
VLPPELPGGALRDAGPAMGAQADSGFWAAASVLTMLVLAVLDSAALQVVLPQMMHSLGVSAGASIWILISFQVTLVACLLPGSALADCIGYRRVFLLGGVLFVMASLGCALSSDMATLCMTRAVQGVGAAAIYSTNPSLVRLIFPGGKLARGIALSSMTNALSLALAPSIGTAILMTAGWRWIFFINLPIGIAGLVVGMFYLPSVRRQRLVALGEGLDARSIALSILFLPLFLVGCDRLAFEPWSGLAMVACSFAAALLLFARQRRRLYQMIPVSLFRQPVFSLSLVCSSLSFLALSSAYTALPFLLERGAAAVMREVALYMMIPPLFTAAANAGVVVLLRHFSETLLCSLGMVAMAVGLAMLGALNPSGPTLYLALALLGLGFGIFQTPNNRMILGTASADRSGNVSGTLAVARTIGQTGGSTVVSVSLATLAHNGGAIALCIAAAAAAASGVVGLGCNSRSG